MIESRIPWTEEETLFDAITVAENSNLELCRGQEVVAGGDGGGDRGAFFPALDEDGFSWQVGSSTGVFGVGGGFAGSDRDEFFAFLRPEDLVRSEFGISLPVRASPEGLYGRSWKVEIVLEGRLEVIAEILMTDWIIERAIIVELTEAGALGTIGNP